LIHGALESERGDRALEFARRVRWVVERQAGQSGKPCRMPGDGLGQHVVDLPGGGRRQRRIHDALRAWHRVGEQADLHAGRSIAASRWSNSTSRR
jgi:hypothetical protein